MQTNFQAMMGLATVAAMLFGFACASSNAEGSGGSGKGAQNGDPFLRSSVPRDTNPDVGAGEIDELVGGNTAFASDLYQWLIQSNDNLIFSPYSISMALAMAYAGADGQAKSDMAGVLHFTLPDETLHSAFNRLDLTLANLGRTGGGDEGRPFTLNIANALWGQKNVEITPDFLDTLALNYGAGLGQVDFRGDPEGSAQIVNDWIADKTEDRIRNTVDPDTLTPETVLLIVNAVYFLANWEMPFNEDSTRDDVFHTMADGEVTVPMMGNADRFRYAAGDGWQAVSLPYVGRQASMAILLPETDAFGDFQDSLDASRISEILGSLESREVWVTMPRFEFESSLQLADTLKDMGMESAFEGGFAGILVEPILGPVCIDEVIHKAFISVDEAGTEAAAATVVEIVALAEPDGGEEPVRFRVDHPFIFLIVEESTNTILFMGRVLNPAR